MKLIEITRGSGKDEDVRKRRDNDGWLERFYGSCNTGSSDCDTDCDTPNVSPQEHQQK